MSTVTFHSEVLGGEVTVRFDCDAEELHYQFGVIASEFLIDSIMVTGIELGPHLRDSVAAALAQEAEEAFREQCEMEAAL